MARLAGMPGYPVAVIPHPIGSLGSAEIAARADSIGSRIEELLLGSPRCPSTLTRRSVRGTSSECAAAAWQAYPQEVRPLAHRLVEQAPDLRRERAIAFPPERPRGGAPPPSTRVSFSHGGSPP